MRRTRFKILAGMFGVSVVGMVAFGQPPVCIPPVPQTVTVPCPTPPVETVQATTPCVPAPTPSPAPAQNPIITCRSLTGGQAAGTSGFNFNTTAPLPSNTLPDLAPAPLPPSTTPTIPVPPAATQPPALLPMASLSQPGPAMVPPPPTTTPVANTTIPATPNPPPSALPTVISVAGTTASTVRSEALQVCLKLGDGHPKFEVCRGDDVLLKVVCTAVDVKAPSEKGEPFSVLRAGGIVLFTAPGCEGTCEELVVHPVTGDVILTKNVEVKCQMGKGNTVMKAEQMTFKLGTAPAFAVTDIGSAILPTSGRQ
jgi:hypothetical protein